MSTDTHQNGPEPTFTPAEDAAEQAAWEALQKEDTGDAEGGSIEPGSGAPGDGAQADPGATVSETGDQSGGTSEQGGEVKPEAEPGKPSELESYKAAMKEERAKRQQLEQEFSDIKQAIAAAKEARDRPAEPEIPSLDEDPVAHFAAKQALLDAKLDQTVQTQQEQLEAQQAADAERQFYARVAQAEQEFAATKPDYHKAVDHLSALRVKQLEMVYPDTDQGVQLARSKGFASPAEMRQAHLSQEIAMYADQAINTGQNPGELFYNLALANGYSSAPAPAPVTPQQKVETARAGVERAQSLSGGGGSGNSNNASVAELTELFMSNPEEADRLWEQLEAQGQLG